MFRTARRNQGFKTQGAHSSVDRVLAQDPQSTPKCPNQAGYVNSSFREQTRGIPGASRLGRLALRLIEIPCLSKQHGRVIEDDSDISLGLPHMPTSTPMYRTHQTCVSWVQVSAQCKPGMVVHVCNHSSQKVEAGRSEVQGYTQLQG